MFTTTYSAEVDISTSCVFVTTNFPRHAAHSERGPQLSQPRMCVRRLHLLAHKPPLSNKPHVEQYSLFVSASARSIQGSMSPLPSPRTTSSGT
ncbi:hypothetical protein LCGC14_0322720 [marine sediment metagenome]|uniref:Uncharacterized protein n=1 Tax=marine sediment metagenome TaxID=412755 RepID=A0A0F9WQN9_9ZZZZ